MKLNLANGAARMESSKTGGWSTKRRLRDAESLDHDILCVIFSFLDLFDLGRCTVVCKPWNKAITRLKLLEVLCCKLQRDSSNIFNTSTYGQSLEMNIEQVAMKYHKLSLLQAQIDIDQWKGHSVRVGQCRMNMGLVLTGVGDKVMRLWSLDSYDCMEEYPVPDTLPLIDFDFDESKIVGLVGSRICIWKRKGITTLFPSHQGTVSKGLCMSYSDPKALVGCEDGTARVFDMYSRRCSQIIRMQSGSITCIHYTDDHKILTGSSNGCVRMSDPLSNQQFFPVKLRHSTGGISSMSFNPSSYQVFAGTTSGYISSWDLRKTNKELWERDVSPNVIYSMQHMRNDTSLLAVGGIDGVLRLLDQTTGEVRSSLVLDGRPPRTSSKNKHKIIYRKNAKRLPENFVIDRIFRSARPPITCLAVGMKKIVTMHNDKHISIWKFNKMENYQN